MYLPPWRIDLVTRPDVVSALSDAAIADAVARVLAAAGAPSPGSVTVVLTDNDELAELNREHMGHDGPTDVLSFPMLHPEAFTRDGRDGSPAPEPTGIRRRHIGDIAISIERAIEQAEQGKGGQTSDVRWSAADEVRLLVTHGVLHLCGWDHLEPGDEAAMRAIEGELLAGVRP